MSRFGFLKAFNCVMRFGIVGLGLVALAVVGCQPAKPKDQAINQPSPQVNPNPAQDLTKPVPDNPAATTTAPTPSTSTPGTSTPIDPSISKLHPPGKNADAVKAPKENITAWTPPISGANGWVPMDDPNFGSKLDKALYGLKETFGGSKIFYEAANGHMQSLDRLIIRDRQKFRLEYTLPRTGSSADLLISDGKSVVRSEGLQWVSQSEGDSTDPDTWIRDYPRHYLDGFGTDQPNWDPLFKALREGKDGYKVTTETKTFIVKGVSSTLERMLATKDNPQTEFEVEINTNLNLPVTMRLKSFDKDGKTYDILWTCEWQQGGAFAEAFFNIPIGAKK